MPVQINEVIIKTTVNATTVKNGDKPSATKNDAADYEAVEKVLEIIREKKER